MKKKYKLYNWLGFIGMVISVCLFYTSKEFVENSETIEIILLISACLVMFGSVALICIGDKLQKQYNIDAQKISEDATKEKIINCRNDSSINEILYEFIANEQTELNDLIKKSACYTGYYYDEKHNDFNFSLSCKKVVRGNGKRNFIASLDKNDDEQVLFINGDVIDVTSYSKEQIVKLLVDELTPFVLKESKSNEFNIKAPKGHLWFSVILSAVSLGGALALLLIQFNDEQVWRYILAGILLLFVLIGLLGVYGWFREEFILIDGVYTYRSLFKTKSCEAREIGKVILKRGNGVVFTVIFMDRNDEVLIKFLDEGTAFRSGEFNASLGYYGIELKVQY